MISQGLEGFLNWLRETEQQLHMAEQWEQEANDATQDILHRLELGELAAEDAGRLALKLREVRQKCREAKDLLDQAGPVADWLESRRASGPEAAGGPAEAPGGKGPAGPGRSRGGLAGESPGGGQGAGAAAGRGA